MQVFRKLQASSMESNGPYERNERIAGPNEIDASSILCAQLCLIFDMICNW